MGTSYDTDVIAWANEQAELLLARKFDEIDVEHVADEIKGVAFTEELEFGRELSSLMAFLLKWRYQDGWRCEAWRGTIGHRRWLVEASLRETPSLRELFADEEWLQCTWDDAAREIRDETGLLFPEQCPWTVEQILDATFFPE